MPTPRPRRPLWADAALLTLLCLLTYAIAPTSHGLTNWQEAQRVVVAREMLANHEWIVPTFDTHPYLAKPPLFYWVQMGLATLRSSPVTELDLRLAAALGGLLGVLATWYAALRLFGYERPTEPVTDPPPGPDPRTAAFLSALLLATGILYVRSSRIGELDIWLVPFTSAAIGLLFTASQRRLNRGRTAWAHIAAAALCATGAALTKGPPGLAAIALGGYAGIALAALIDPSPLDSRPRAVWRAWSSTHPDIVLGLAIAALWGWAHLVSQRIGERAVAAAAEFEAESNLQLFNLASPLRNLEAMAYGVALGSILALLAFVWLLKDRPRLRLGWIVLLAWVGLGFIAFSLLGKGIPRYLTPLWPAVAMLGGLFAAQWLSTTRRPRALRAALYTAVAALALAQTLWYTVGREHYAPHRSPRALIAELHADPALAAMPAVLVGFETPAIAYYRGRFPQAYDSHAIRSISAGAHSPGLEALHAAMKPGEQRLAFVAAFDGAEVTPQTLAAYGFTARPVPTTARFAAKGGRLPVETYIITPAP